ncbi:MAG TPA: hypothetical protein PLP19_11585 [bacterium]|nr:hypothetical protein [bacterium]HPN44122.1 hypothetical protein [bacterium]
MKWNSFINCGNLDFGLNIDDIIMQMLSKPEYYSIKGVLQNQEIDKIIAVIANSNIYSPVEKNMIITNLGDKHHFGSQ